MESLLVTIHCLVYNHEPYLRQCLDGFVMQKTNFKFEAIVHDDCSTDGSADIIREYAKRFPNIIKPIYEKENQYSKVGFSGINEIMFSQIKGEYIAFCEGDDCWIDPLKLQKQVDILDQEPGLTLVYTGFHNIDFQNNLIRRKYYEKLQAQSPSGDILGLLFEKNYVMTVTAMYRKSLCDSMLFRRCPVFYDYSLALTAAMLGKVRFLSDKTACYRMTPGSLIVSHKESLKDDFDKIYAYYAQAFVKNNGFTRTIFQRTIVLVHIILGAMDNQVLLKELCKKKTIKMFYPLAWIIRILSRIISKISRIKNRLQ